MALEAEDPEVLTWWVCLGDKLLIRSEQATEDREATAKVHLEFRSVDTVARTAQPHGSGAGFNSILATAQKPSHITPALMSDCA